MPGLRVAAANSSTLRQRATLTNWNSASGATAWCKAVSI